MTDTLLSKKSIIFLSIHIKNIVGFGNPQDNIPNIPKIDKKYLP